VLNTLERTQTTWLGVERQTYNIEPLSVLACNKTACCSPVQLMIAANTDNQSILHVCVSYQSSLSRRLNSKKHEHQRQKQTWWKEFNVFRR